MQFVEFSHINVGKAHVFSDSLQVFLASTKFSVDVLKCFYFAISKDVTKLLPIQQFYFCRNELKMTEGMASL